jgi:hypothetical protein
MSSAAPIEIAQAATQGLYPTLLAKDHVINLTGAAPKKKNNKKKKASNKLKPVETDQDAAQVEKEEQSDEPATPAVVGLSLNVRAITSISCANRLQIRTKKTL